MSSFEIDLLNYIIENGTVKYSEIAKKFKKTSPAVYAAIKRLRQKGVLEGVYPKINLSEFGYDFTAFILARVGSQNIPELVKEHGGNPNIICIYQVSGEFDLLFVCKFKSTKELYSIVQELSRDSRVEAVDAPVAYNVFKEGLNPSPITPKED